MNPPSHTASVPAGPGTVPLQLSAAHRRRIEHLARDGYPNEACGLLIGRGTDQGVAVERVVAATNLAAERLADRYLLDPEEHLRADIAAQRDGLEVVGVWHSHPDHPALPSKTDLEAAWESYVYVIVSVRHGSVADFRAWALESTSFAERPIEEVEG